jgi:hypothetical protein
VLCGCEHAATPSGIVAKIKAAGYPMTRVVGTGEAGEAKVRVV